MPRNCFAVAVAVLLLAFTGVASAQIEEIGPFEGDMFDGFETYGQLFEEEIDFFEGEVTVGTTFDGPGVFVLRSSRLNDVTVFPHSGGWLMGIGAPGIWEFHTPVQQFGGYFATNSEGADATVEFFDAEGNLIDTLIAEIDAEKPNWTWNGWSSDIPIARMEITGNGTNRGFIDFDDMWITFPAGPPPAVPTASQWALTLLALCVLTAGVFALRGHRAGRLGR